MSKRDAARIKFHTSWLEHEDNPLGKWASNYAREMVVGAIPTGESAHGINVTKTIDTHTEDTKHTLEYKLRYKSLSPGRRLPRWSHVFRSIMFLRELQSKAPSVIEFKVDCDLQSNRLPWVFIDKCNDSTVTSIAKRPGAKSYLIQLPKVVALPKGPGRFHRLMQNDMVFTPTMGDEILIVGEPRTAYKAYRYFSQLERGASLSSRDQHDRSKYAAFGDLVVVLTRNTEVSLDWQLYSEDNHQCSATWMKYALCATEAESPVTYLGLDYEHVRLEEPYYKHDPAI